MSKKQFKKFAALNSVVALPSRQVKRNGEDVTLYNIYKM